MPERIQRKRTKGWRMPEGARYVGRGSRWGNPFYRPFTAPCSVFGQPWNHLTTSPLMPRHTSAYMQGDVMYVTCSDADTAVTHAVKFFENYCASRQRDIPDPFSRWLDPLRGQDLACWCALGADCHADVLLSLANSVTVAS